MRARGSERGQILVIVAAGMLVLIAISAIVVDLGFSWMLRRQEQNAADPAALAAARFISDPDPLTGLQTYNAGSGWTAACHYAHENGFFDTANTACADELDGTKMRVNWPPQGSVSDYWHGDRGHVQVIISDQHPSFFGRVLGQDRTTVTTGAVAARQRGNTNSHSLISLKPDGCNTAEVRGNGRISIFPAPGYTGPGGYVQVNSDCGSNTSDDHCSNGQGALNINGTASLKAPRVDVHGGCNGPGSQPTFPSILDEAALQVGDPLAGIRFPVWDTSVNGAKCGQTGANLTSAASQGCGQGGGRLPWQPSADSACPGMPTNFDCIELNPGVYYGGWDIGTKVRVTLKPGIYIIAGGGISIGSSGALDSLAGTSAPAPVLIYSTDNPVYKASCPGNAKRCQGNLDLTASSDLKLAPLLASQPCPPVTTVGGCPFGGMVIWMDGDGSRPAGTTGNPSCANFGCVDVEGGGTLSISGTIYAPRAHVDITGNVNTNCGATSLQVAAVQIIAWTWDLGGTGDLCMPYDPAKLFKFPAQGLVN